MFEPSTPRRRWSTLSHCSVARRLRLIRLRLVSGRDFSAGEVADADDASITCLVLADGIIVGGLTFVLDPALSEPARETRTLEEREAQAEHEKDCCCTPCVDDRCRDECRCCRHGHRCRRDECRCHDDEHDHKQECLPEPPPCGDRARVRQVWVALDLESGPEPG